MDRTSARACAMKLVYEWELGGEGGDDTKVNLLEIDPTENETDFMNELTEGVKYNYEVLDEQISKFLAEGWKLERVSRVDRAILLIAAYEMLYTDLSHSIIINEAVELANIYSADKAGAFVNGVLGNMSRSRTNA